MVLSDKVHVSHDRNGKGKGIFAKVDIDAGERVWWWDKTDEIIRIYTREEIIAMQATDRELIERYSYMIDDDTYASTTDPDEDPSYYFNHACAPNCWYRNDSLVTNRAVRAGEELNYDYAFTETEISFHAGMKCLCGADTCRGVLKFREYRLKQWMAENYDNCSEWIKRKSKEMGYLNPNAYLRRDTTYNCYGIKAHKPIAQGDVILVFAGKLVNYDELTQLSIAERHLTLQVADNLWQVPVQKEASDFVNHSCNPNSGMLDSTTLVALRNIEPEEEISFDYATVNTGVVGNDIETDNFECYCGSSNCRQWISATDWMIPELQERYAGYWPKFMQKLIDQHKAERNNIPEDRIYSAPIRFQQTRVQAD